MDKNKGLQPEVPNEKHDPVGARWPQGTTPFLTKVYEKGGPGVRVPPETEKVPTR